MQDDTAKHSFAEKLKSFDILPQNCALIKSASFVDRLNGMVFFRRVLAVDKKPPIDLIIELECVIPALIQCLYETNAEKLQVEATWCLTNISCGESHHIAYLLSHNVLDALMTVISTTKSNVVRENAIWAVNNLAVDERVCQIIGANMTILSSLLFQVGVECYPYSRGDDVNGGGVRYGWRHRPMNDNPALSTMRHVTFICGNLIRSKSLGNVDVSTIGCVLFALADLFQSPDEEVILDICQSIAFIVAQYGDIAVNLILEQGMVSRLVELLDCSTFEELSLVAICAILKSPQSYHRKLVLQKLIPSIAQSTATALTDLNSNTTKKTLLGYCGSVLLKSLNQLVIKDILSGLLAIVELESALYSAELYGEGFLDLMETLCKDAKREIRVEISYLLYHMFRGGTLLLQVNMKLSKQDEEEGEVLMALFELLDNIFECAIENHEVLNLPEFQDRLDALVFHPLQAIAEQSRHLDHRLKVYTDSIFGDVEN